MLVPTLLSLFARFYARGVTNFRWQFLCQYNYLSGFLSGVIILFLAFNMAEELTFDGYSNYNNMLVTKQFK